MGGDGRGDVIGPAPQRDPLGWWFDACRDPGRTESSVSLELRWFGRGDAPAAVAAITADGRVEHRLDHYALLGRDDLGLKLRGRSRLALKQRRCRLTVVEGLPPAERWTRRSARTSRRWVAEGPSWLTVRKHRARVLVDLADDDPVPASGRRASVPRGGAIELVRLEPHGEPELWTVACETWGPGDRDNLARLVEWSGIDWLEVDRAAALSAGYPAALSRLVAPAC